MKTKNQKLKVVSLDLLDWGASAGGEHYYAKLCFTDKKGKDKTIQLQNTLTQKMATYLNKKEGCRSYKKGDESLKFDTPQDAVKVALKTLEDMGEECDLILRNSSGFMSVCHALWGDDAKVKRINELYKEADEIGWYSHPSCPNKKQDDKMEAIDKEFDKILGRK